MYKNMTRKGLALGAGIALTATGLVALPASAAVDLSTTLASGTSYNSVTGYNQLALKTTISADFSAIDGTLKYRVVNAGLATVDVLAGTVLAEIARPNNTNGELNEYTKNVDLADADGTQAGLQTNDNDFVVDLVAGSFVNTGSSAGVGLYTSNNFLALSVLDAVATDVTLTVQAWLDQNDDNVIDATEKVGAINTVNFYDETSIQASTSLDAPVLGATSVSATVTTTPALNGEQLGADFFAVSFTAQGNTNAVLATKTTTGSVAGTTTYSAVTNSWTSTAQLAYSVATDAWNGSNNTTDTETLTAAAGDVHTGGAATTLVLDFQAAHGFVTTGGTWVASTTAITDSTASPNTFAAQALKPVVADSETMTITTTGLATVAANALTAPTTDEVVTLYSVGANSGAVVAGGTYSATPYLGTVKLGAISSTGASSTTGNDTKAVIAGTVDVTGSANETGATETVVTVRKGQTTVTAVATIYYANASSVQTIAPAGVPVTGYLTNAGTGTFQINAAGAGVTSSTVLTDANGQVTFTVTNSLAANTDGVDLEIRPQSIPSADAKTAEFDIDWAVEDYELFDMKATDSQPSSAQSYRSITASGTYTFDFALLDQWGVSASDAAYRLQVINADRTVSSTYATLSNGRASVVVADAAQGASAYITTTVNVQKLTAGTWGTVAGDSWASADTVQINVLTAQTDSILLDVATGQTYESNNSANVGALFVADTALKATVAQDRRTSAVSQPAYDNASSTAETVVIHGRVVNSLTSAQRAGQVVTVTGDSSILFSDGKVDSFGSISIVTSSEGDFTVNAFSNNAQANSVITVTTADGATKTQKVTFNGVAKTAGTAITVTSPANALPGSTFQVVVKVVDVYGNAVNTATNAQLQITYTGPGIVFGALPTDLGALGTATFAVLLGQNDTGSATITATYDKGDNGSFLDATGAVATDDLSATTSIVVGAAAVAASATKVNVGSFKGYVALYAKGYKGKKMSAIVAGKWIVVASLATDFERVVRYTGAGYDIVTTIYIDGAKVETFNVTTK